MATQFIAREALVGTFHSWRLWLIHFVVNPALFGLFSLWLLIPEASTLYLILQILVAIVIFAGVIALHGGTLNYFHDRVANEKASIKESFLRALRNILPITICLVVVVLLWLLIDKLNGYQDSFPTYLRSTFPASWRKHITLQSLLTAYSLFISTLRWVVLPGLLLPCVACSSYFGYRGFGGTGFRAWWSALRSRSYWIILLIAVMVGVLAPRDLVTSVPDFKVSTYSHEWVSLIFRLFFAYVLGLVAWMLACSVTGRVTGSSADASRNPGA